MIVGKNEKTRKLVRTKVPFFLPKQLKAVSSAPSNAKKQVIMTGMQLTAKIASPLSGILSRGIDHHAHAKQTKGNVPPPNPPKTGSNNAGNNQTASGPRTPDHSGHANGTRPHPPTAPPTLRGQNIVSRVLPRMAFANATYFFDPSRNVRSVENPTVRQRRSVEQPDIHSTSSIATSHAETAPPRHAVAPSAVNSTTSIATPGAETASPRHWLTPSAIHSTPSTATPDTETSNDAAYLRELGQTLNDWVDYDKAQAHANDAYELLQAVLDHYGEPLPESFKTTLNLSLIEDQGRVDEAALLYYRLQRDGAREGNSSVPPESSAQLRSQFISALRPAVARHHALEQLFTQPALNTTTTTPFFDGFVLRNALGKSFDDLLNSPDISTDPTFATASAQHKRELLSAKFEQMGESIQYPIGTPQHSLASVLGRVAKYRLQPAPGQFQSEEILLTQFQQCENGWSEDRSSFPLNPRVLFTLHLAQSNGVEILSTEELSNRYQRIMEQAIKLSNTGDWDARTWLQSIPARWNAEGKRWTNREPSVKREALLATFDMLRRMSLCSETPAGVSAQKIWDFAQEIKQAGLLGEVLVGDNWKEKTTALLRYANERLFALYGSPPQSFNRNEAARQILEQYGMSDTEIERGRHYTLTADKANLSQSKFGDRIEEFLDRADWTGILDRSMRVGGQTIYPQQELQKAEEAFNNKLPSNEWIRAKAKENLRMKSIVITNATVDAEARRIANNYRAETENHRTWMRGFDAWINTIPVLGPIYNIEEGIRHKDVGQALLGTLFLGLDLLDLTSSGAHSHGEIHIKSMPTYRRSAMADFHHVTTQLGAETVRVPEHAEAHSAPPQLRQQDGNVPSAYRSLATRVRSGETGVKWQDYDVVLIANENRIVPVKHVGGSYHEIDWHTGHRARSARLIRRDPNTRTFHTDGGLHAGAPTERLTDRKGNPIEERLTPTEVEEFLRKSSNTLREAFGPRFHSCFSVIETSNQAWGGRDMQAFLERLYNRSHTFRRMLNHYYDTKGPDNRLWKIYLGGRPLNTEVRAYADFDRRIIEMPRQEELVRLTFTSAGETSTYTQDSALLHEVIHALTHKGDPPRHNRRFGFQYRNYDRGPVVYLTDKIMSEAGFRVEERVSYRDLQKDIDDHLLSKITHNVNMENLYLDPIVDAQRPRVTADTLVEEVPVQDRLTVKQWKKIQRRLDEAAGKKSVALLQRKLDENFELRPPAGQGSNFEEELITEVTRVYRRFLKDSATFRALVETMPEVPGDNARRWKFVFNPNAAPKDPVTGRALSGVDDFQKHIYLFEDDAKYLSEQGLFYIEFQRKVASAFVHAMTDLKMPKAELYNHRGAAVRLVDKILAESGFHFPQQTVAGLTSRGDRAERIKLQARLTSARRNMEVEEAYINQGMPDIRVKRSAGVLRHQKVRRKD
jgi:hypothetical protein